MSAPTRILLVEDSRSDARLLEATLQDAGVHRFKLTHVERLDEALAALGDGGVDVVLLDLHLPDSQGLDTLAQLKREQPGVPVVVLTGLDDEELAVRAMHQFLDILADGLAGALNDEQQAYIQRTLRNARQLESMVAELLDAVRAQTGKLAVTVQRVELAPLVSDAVGGFAGRAADKAIDLGAEVQPSLAAVRADAGRVGQVLGNLLDNALKFTPEGGEVRVSALEDGEPGFARVEVADNGPGVPADVAERIFERLWQVEDDAGPSRKGLGLGLHICRELVARQGGRIWVDSRPGEGATFAFTLPLDQKGADQSVPAATAEASSPG